MRAHTHTHTHELIHRERVTESVWCMCLCVHRYFNFDGLPDARITQKALTEVRNEQRSRAHKHMHAASKRGCACIGVVPVVQDTRFFWAHTS